MSNGSHFDADFGKDNDRLQRATEIMMDVVRRRNAGENVADAEVIQSNPELTEELRRLLSGVRLIRAAASRATVENWEDALGRMEKDDIAEKQSTELIRRLPSFESEISPSALQEVGGRTLQELHDDIEATIAAPPSRSDDADSISTRQEAVESDGIKEGTRKVPTASRSFHTRRFRPAHRAPVAVLQVYDDDLSGAEQVRIRTAKFVIGREEGDLVLKNETRMSRQHLAIECVLEKRKFKWYLTDLGSTNGTFIGARRIRLKDKDELLVGSSVVRFFQGTGNDCSSLAKVSQRGVLEQVELTEGFAHRIGTDRLQCLPFLSDDVLLDPSHIRLVRDDTGRWSIHDDESTNGLMLRITKIRLRDGCVFHAGEQRFSFHLP